MSFFGTDRRGPPKKIWISETESVDVPGTHGVPARLSGFRLANGDGRGIEVVADGNAERQGLMGFAVDSRSWVDLLRATTEGE